MFRVSLKANHLNAKLDISLQMMAAAFNFEHQPGNEEELRQIQELLQVVEKQSARLGFTIPKPQPQEIWHIVGDPKKHQLDATYNQLVDRMSDRFHEARRAAIKRMRTAGLYNNCVPIALEIGRGLYSLSCLRLAGMLYFAHVVAVIDVRHHQTAVESATTRMLPSFA